MQYIWWTTSGAKNIIERKRSLSLAELQKFVGGNIEMVWVGEPYKSYCLIVNEDGKLIGLPVNKKFPQLVGDVIECQVQKNTRGGYDFVGFEKGGKR